MSSEEPKIFICNNSCSCISLLVAGVQSVNWNPTLITEINLFQTADVTAPPALRQLH